MARVHRRKAAKDYPQQGIAKGDMYYYVKIKTGPRTSREMRSKTPYHTRDNGDDAYEFDEDEWLDRVREVSVDE